MIVDVGIVHNIRLTVALVLRFARFSSSVGLLPDADNDEGIIIPKLYIGQLVSVSARGLSTMWRDRSKCMSTFAIEEDRNAEPL